MARSPRAVVDEPSRIDRLFGAATTASGLLVLVLLVLVGYFLFLRSGRCVRRRGVVVLHHLRLAHRRRPTRDRRARPGVRHGGRGDHRRRHRRAARHVRRPVHHRIRHRALAQPPHRPRRPPGRHPQPAVRPLGLPAARRTRSSPCPSGWAATSAGSRSSASDEGAELTGSMLIAGIGRVADGAADRRLGLPRGVHPDATRREGGGAGARRDAVGDDPHGRAAVRQGRHHRRVDARVSAGRSARPSRCRCCSRRSPR